MTSTLALSPLPAGIQSMPAVSRSLPAFHLSIGTVSTSQPVPSGATAMPQGAAEIDPEGALMTPPGMMTTHSAAASGIPASVAQLLGADDQAAADTTVTAPPVARPVQQPVTTRSEISLTDEDQDVPTTDTVVTGPGNACAPLPLLATLTVIDTAVAIGLLPAMSRETNAGRQTATSISAGDVQPKTATTSAIEPQIKSDAFEAALSFANTSAPSTDIRSITSSAVFGVGELSGAQGVAERHLNLARDTLWLDQLATDIISASDTTDRISFRLTPAYLGQLDVNLLTSDAGLTVNIATSTEEASKIVTAAQSGLVESLQAQGIRVADTQITSGNDNSQYGQPHRQHTAHHLIETAVTSSEEPDHKDSERPDGRFA